MENPLAKIPKEKLIYPIIGVLFFATAITLFILTARALYRQSIILFSANGGPKAESVVSTQDIAAVKHKLGITAPDVVAPVPVLPSPSPVAVPVSPKVKPQDVRVAVFSTVTTAGAAAALKQDLEKAGFVVVKVGNQRPVRINTGIQIKDSKRETIDALRETIAKKYGLDPTTSLDETNADYDAVVVIGKTRAETTGTTSGTSSAP